MAVGELATIAHAEINWSVVFGTIITSMGGIIIYMIQRNVTRSDEEKKALQEKVEADKEAADKQRNEDKKAAYEQRESDRKSADLQREADKLAAGQARKEIADAVAEDRRLFDEKLQKMGTLFANQLTAAATTFGGQVEKTSENFMREVREMKTALDLVSKEMSKLSNTMVQIERESTVRYEAINKRFEDFTKESHETFAMHWKEIKDIREWKHATDTVITRLVATTGVADLKRDAWEKETAQIRKEVLARIEILEKISEDVEEKKAANRRRR